jgi:hypothetical protein
MADVTWLDYTIHLTDKQLVDELQQAIAKFWLPVNNDGGALEPRTLGGFDIAPKGDVYAAPARMAALYNAPIIPLDQAFHAPCITSPWIESANSQTFRVDQDRFEKNSWGWFGKLFGTNKVFRWRGRFALAASTQPIIDGNPVANPATISVRHWIEGFEMPNGGGGARFTRYSREASRHPDGYGFAMRGDSGSPQATHVVGSKNYTEAWERLYVRLRKAPSGLVHFWRCHVNIDSAAGVALAIDATGRIAIQNINGSAVETTLATIPDPLPIDKWVRLDLHIGVGLVEKFEVYVGGKKKVSVNGTSLSPQPPAARVIANTRVGDDQAVNATRQLGLDIDDWEQSDWPPTQDGVDWLSGTRIVRVDADGFADSDDGDWAGDWRACRQNPSDDGTEVITTDIAEALLAVTTNGEQAIDADIGTLGAVALQVGLLSKRDSTNNGKLGYSIAGAAAVMVDITQDDAPQWNVLDPYSPAGLATPSKMTPIELYHQNPDDDGDMDTDTSVVYGLAAQAACLGIWGEEDVIADSNGVKPQPIRQHLGQHNAPYPRTAWARKGANTLQPLAIHGLTYTGNDNVTELTFPIPVHFLYFRPLTSGAGVWWWSTMLAPHPMFDENTRPAATVAIEIDPAFVGTGAENAQEQQTIVRIVGDDQRWNESGKTYQVIAFADPANRNLLNANLAWPRGNDQRTTKLIRTLFSMDASFLYKEAVLGSQTVQLWFQGPEQKGRGAMSLISAAETADAFFPTQGQVVSKQPVHHALTGGQNVSIQVWRKDDTGTDPNKANVVFAFSYVGDGASPRTIDLGSGATVRPLFAVVQPTDARGIMRDPSHLTVQSTNMQTLTETSNGIRGGGIDQIIVGSDLNASGKTYNGFLIWGGEAEGNGGWSDNGDFFPVDPTTGPKDPGDDNVPDDDSGFPTEPNGGDGGGGGSTNPPDLGQGCVAASGQVCNRALSHIGITQRILNLDTETTVEAEQCRLVYSDEVDAVLRAYPWDWATAYATLVLASGTATTPVNGDWQYAYRAPTDLVFGRRIVAKGGDARRKDAPKIPWKLGRDVFFNTWLIFTNEPDAVLEYTCRPLCAATAGDALFRDALSWRIAAALAPALARNKVTAADCLTAFLLKIGEARVANANEQQQRDNGVREAEWIRARQ